MPDYGWAYINLDVLKTVEGPANVTGTIAIIKDQFTLSGSKYLAYATASSKVGVGLNFPTTIPAYQLDISASSGDVVATRMIGDLLVTGSAYISGNLSVDSLHANTVISSSNLIVRDPIIGLGFGDAANETGSVGDRGFIFGLAGDNNQAFLWDQTSGSFVIGKVGAQGPDATSFDIVDTNGILQVGMLTSSYGVSGTLGQFTNITAADIEIKTEHPLLTIRSDAASGDQSIKFRSGDGSQMGLIRSDVTSNTLNHISLGANTSEIQLVLDANARVGVGTQTPQGTLHVSSSTAGDKSLVVSAVQNQSTDVVVVQSKTGDSAFIIDQDGGAAFGSTIKANSLGADTDNTVVIVNSSGFLKTDEADSRIFGSTLVDASGTPVDNQIAIWTDANTVEGSANLTFDGSALTVGNDVSISDKLIHTGDTDTFIKFDTDKIEFTAGGGELLILKEDTQNIVTVGKSSSDTDFQVTTAGNDNTIFVEGSSDKVGIVNGSPEASVSIGSGKHIVTIRQALVKAHDADNTVITEISGFKLPAKSVISRVSAVIAEATDLSTYKVSLQISATSGTGADSSISGGTVILGAGASGTRSAGSTGAATDIDMTSSGKDAFINNDLQWVGGSDQYIYVCNAGTGNGTSDASQGKLVIMVEYYGMD